MPGIDLQIPTCIRMVTIKPITPQDVEAVLTLWHATEGLTVREADSPEGLWAYLNRNPGLSFVARENTEMVGAAICGHDGRRGYLHHLAVAPPYRRQGIGRALVERCLEGLKDEGIQKCHLFVRVDNPAARTFWNHLRWTDRDDIWILSRNLSGSANP